MRKMTFGTAFAFACIGVTCASATGLRVDDGHFVGDFGVGGWTQNFSVKSLVSGGVSVVSNGTNEVGDFQSDVRHRFLWLRADTNCVFVSSTASGGNRWRPGCK